MAEKGQGPTGATINTLNGKQSFDLMKLIEAEYTSSGLNYPGFAQLATERLGFSVNSDHVRNRCNMMGIEPNARRGGQEGAGEILALTQRVQYLEEELARIISYLQHHVARAGHAPAFKDYK